MTFIVKTTEIAHPNSAYSVKLTLSDGAREPCLQILGRQGQKLKSANVIALTPEALRAMGDWIIEVTANQNVTANQ